MTLKRLITQTCLTLIGIGAGCWLAPAAEGRTIEWSGYTWAIKSGKQGPGPNNFSDHPDDVYVDAQGNLRMWMRYRYIDDDGEVDTPKIWAWCSTQITNPIAMGYGRYEFRLQSDPDTYHDNTVVGLFTYENDQQEIDIEFSRWGEGRPGAQYAIQPTKDRPYNKKEWDMELNGGTYSTHIFEWRPEHVTWYSLAGHRNLSDPDYRDYLLREVVEGGQGLGYSWRHVGSDRPTPSGETVRINFWNSKGIGPGAVQHLVIDSFSFTPFSQASGYTSVPEPATGVLGCIFLPLLMRRQNRRTRQSNVQ